MLAQEEQHQNQMMMIKGKRTKRPRPPSPLTLTMSTTVSGDESGGDGRVATSSSITNIDAGAHICSSPTEEEEDMAHCLMLLAQGASKIEKSEYSPAVITVSAARSAAAAVTTVGSSGAGGGVYVYECKTCNRCFPSFQALGGHRASHKKPKLPSEEKGVGLSLMDDNHQQQPERFQSAENGKNSGIEGVGLSLQIACNSSNTLSTSNDHIDNKSKVHACAICGAEFSSGQALGGHMRRHRSLIAAAAGSPASQSASPPAPPRNLLSLDLNLPAEEQEDQQQTQPPPQPESPNFMFASNEKTLVFAASLVDCSY